VVFVLFKKDKMKKLAGVIFFHNAESLDYCYKEAIQCLLECTDHVYVVDAGSDDGTAEEVKKMDDERLTLIFFSKKDWDDQVGREKLSYFTNKGIEWAEKDGYEYVLNIQADEILHQKSYEELRRAVKAGYESYMMKRINLWASPYLQLNVPHNRKPCSTEIIRLAKSCYRSYDDAESISVASTDSYFMNGLRVYHMGFVRKREIHPTKIRTMQKDIFLTNPDVKLEGMGVFDPYQWFSKEDLVPIDEPLPKLIQEWAKERVYED
jgi:glycosyltransferase involved in cell wall biosynthesis